MTSFVRFVLKAKKEASALGDVARDIRDDIHVKRTWCYKTFVKYLTKCGASSRVYCVLEDANESYKTYYKTKL
jgi:hypothetical protein